MKKIIALLLLLALAVTMIACEKDNPPSGDPNNDTPPVSDPAKKSEGVMTYAEYMAAAKDADVVIECYVQATQSWYSDKITVYAADPDGAYFLYNMTCSQEDAAKLTPGTKIKVTGVKTEWAGEVEVAEGATFAFVDDGITYVSESKDLTAELGKDTLVNYQNQKAAFKSMTVKKVEFKNGEPGDDIYLTVTKGGVAYDFCVERYLTDPDTEVYKTVSALVAGDTVDIECFIYWYYGANPHITAIEKKDAAKKSEGVMTYAEYNAAAKGADVVIECYVQATQSWYSDKITVYAADPDGAYFLYNMACSQEDAAKLTPGTKIKVTGVKTEWAGEVEVDEGAAFAFVDDGITYDSYAKDLNAELGKDTLINYQNQKGSFTGLTVKEVEFKNGEPGDDIYLTVTKDGAEYEFCVERYLTDPDTEVYKTVSALVAGDTVDIECFIYWYYGANPHITAIAKK